mmetsp:Transcript_128112/g.250927  ORF Transcript_128112/g.250927 Transcript_128112/m.250927 type:complete len:275 (+) Transcript_128112:239-1063(+)
MQLPEVSVHGIQLLLHAGTIRARLRDGLVKLRGLLDLVFHRLLLRRSINFIFLRLRFICSLRTLLLGGHRGKPLREIRLNDLQQRDDAGTGALGRGVCLVLFCIVLAQDPQSELDALQAFLHINFVRLERISLRCADLVHLGLGKRQLRQRLLQTSNLFLQLRRHRGHLVDLRGQLVDIRRLIRLLFIRLGELLCAMRMLRGVRIRLLLQPLDHVLDEALHLRELVLAAARTRIGRQAHPRGKLRQRRRLLFVGEVAHDADRLVFCERCAICNP